MDMACYNVLNLNQSTKIGTADRRIRGSFGAPLEVLTELWSKVRCTPHPMHLLIALKWLKTYSSESIDAAFFNCDEKTVRKYRVLYVQQLSELETVSLYD